MLLPALVQWYINILILILPVAIASEHLEVCFMGKHQRAYAMQQALSPRNGCSVLQRLHWDWASPHNLPLNRIRSQWSKTWVFVLNFLAIIPLANLLGIATEVCETGGWCSVYDSYL